MHTLARPKRIEFIGSDGNSYYVLCKPDDEMRKDARFMDLARVCIRLFYKIKLKF